MATRYFMTYEAIRQEEARLQERVRSYPVNGRKTSTGTIKMIRKEIGDMTFRIARKCNVSVNYPRWSIQGKKVVLGDPSILLPTLRYVSFEELKAIELGYEVQLINVNSKMRKNLFYFLTKKGRTFPLVKISFFERY